MKPNQLRLDAAIWHDVAPPDDTTARLCSKCNLWRPASEYYPEEPYWCKLCFNRYQQDHVNPDRHANRVRSLRKNYGMSHEQYDRMFAAQNGLCAACHQTETKCDPRTHELKWLTVDHDHTTGAIRALLCQECNSALGLLQDDPARCAALLAYAERTRQRAAV